MSAFAASAWRRLVPVAGVAGAWLALEALLGGPAAAASPRSAPPPADVVAITIDSTAAVGAWTVVADGAPLAPTAADAHRWRGAARARRLDVRAEPADPLADGPAALRVHVARGGAGRERLLWGEGAVAGAIDLADGP